jgi:hypothetical protein
VGHGIFFDASTGRFHIFEVHLQGAGGLLECAIHDPGAASQLGTAQPVTSAAADVFRLSGWYEIIP